MTEVNFEDEFWDLAVDLVGVQLVFYNRGEPGWALHDVKTESIVAINKNLSWKHKFFVLCHEVGHLFLVDNPAYFVRSYTEDETIAHQRAKTLIERADRELTD